MTVKIFVGQTTEGLPFLVETLKGYNVVAADQLTRAKELIDQDGIELFVLGVHFDDSRCLELVNFIRTDPRHREVPVLVIRTIPSDYADVLRQTMKLIATLHGISDYLELEGVSDKGPIIREAVSKIIREKKITAA